MISQYVMDFATSLQVWLTTLFPSFTVPDWFTNLGTTVNGITAKLGGIGVWVPWALCFSVLAAALATWVTCLGIKLVLRIASYLPFIGGAG